MRPPDDMLGQALRLCCCKHGCESVVKRLVMVSHMGAPFIGWHVPDFAKPGSKKQPCCSMPSSGMLPVQEVWSDCVFAQERASMGEEADWSWVSVIHSWAHCAVRPVLFTQGEVW